jgi:hypothetical protein
MTATKHGKPLLHKAKQNSNGTFSKGKTWQLEDMRQVEQLGVSRVGPFTPRTTSRRPLGQPRPARTDTRSQYRSPSP